MKDIKKSELKKTVIFIALFVVMSYLIGPLLSKTGIEWFSRNLTSVVYASLFLIALLLYWKELIRSIKRFNEKDFEQTAIIGFLTLAANVMAGIFLASISVRNENEIAIDSMTDHNVILFKFAVILFAPVVEELVFRHGIYGLFGKRHFLGCIITTFLFAFMHVGIEVLVYGQWSQLIVMIPYLAFGLGLNIAYQRTQNVIYPIMIHMIINGIGAL